MRITESVLRRVIRHEIKRVLREAHYQGGPGFGGKYDAMSLAQEVYDNITDGGKNEMALRAALSNYDEDDYMNEINQYAEEAARSLSSPPPRGWMSTLLSNLKTMI